MKTFLICVGAVALGEIGDKTQFLSLALASRFQRPVPILLGVLLATLANHLLAASVGAWIAHLLGPRALHVAVGLSFIALGAWALVPDSEDRVLTPRGGAGVFAFTLASFFLAEMGDKTQVVTMALAAKYQDIVLVLAGTTTGILLVSIPTVLLAQRLAHLVSLRHVRFAAALVYFLLGVVTLSGMNPFG